MGNHPARFTSIKNPYFEVDRRRKLRKVVFIMIFSAAFTLLLSNVDTDIE